jgi:hypothetical protein
MEKKEVSEGNCFLCGVTLGKIKMKNHIIKAHELAGENSKVKSEKALLVKVEGAYDKDYWLYLDIAFDAALFDLDDFLRKIWLECCGHMSAFFRAKYDEIDMKTKMRSIAPGSKLLYEYDFGSTTELLISVLADVRRAPQKLPVRLLSRNVPPEFKCTDCGKPAENISRRWAPNKRFFYCEKCSEKHEDECENGMILPVVNSPRMGECGYDGELDTYTFDRADFEAE